MGRPWFELQIGTCSSAQMRGSEVLSSSTERRGTPQFHGKTPAEWCSQVPVGHQESGESVMAFGYLKVELWP